MFIITTILKNYIKYNTFNILNEKLIKIIKDEIPEFYYYLQQCENEIEYLIFFNFLLLLKRPVMIQNVKH